MDLFGIIDLIEIRQEEERQRREGILSEKEREIKCIEERGSRLEYPSSLRGDNVYCGVERGGNEEQKRHDLNSCLLPSG